MPEPYIITQGDTTPPMRIPLADERGATPLFGATMTLLMQQFKGAKFVTGPCVAVNAAAVVPHPDTGLVDYPWRIDGTDTNVAGVFRAKVRVVFGDGRVEHFPSDGWIEVVIRDTPGP